MPNKGSLFEGMRDLDIREQGRERVLSVQAIIPRYHPTTWRITPLKAELAQKFITTYKIQHLTYKEINHSVY
jgi:hypothetical protein